MDNTTTNIFDRTRRLVGDEALRHIGSQRVILFGVGGVGSWCAEGLVRSGIGHLTLVDPDCVNVSNINRQLMATTATVGQPKVEVLRERLLTINPEAEILTSTLPYNPETAPQFNLDSYDYVIDAIDSLQDKALLILNATKAKCHFVSSMGAALKCDPQRIKVAEFWNVEGCPLARALRKKFKKSHHYPAHKFRCVYSDEVLPNKGVIEPTTNPSQSYADPKKAQINGSLVHITAIFGFTLSGIIMQDLTKE